MKFDGSEINFLIAFIAGILTFLASCLLPLVPIYLSYLSGIVDYNNPKNLSKVLKNAIAFVTGFIFIFVLLGATVNTLGFLLAKNRLVIQKIGGSFFILLGILFFSNSELLGLKTFRFPFPKLNKNLQLLNSFLVGVTFGFSWIPCIGPVLAVILFMASIEVTFYKGILFLLSYGLGLGIPFIVVALGYGKILLKLTKYEKIIRLISALLIIITGIFLLQGTLTVVSLRILEILGLNRLAI